MCNNENNTCENCIADILKVILILQQSVCQNDCCMETCDRGFLGQNSSLCYNTRPINFYNCMSGTLWTFPYTLGETSNTSSVFRIENMEDNCCTCRVLAPNPVTSSEEPYVSTNSFFTINLDCVSAIKCLADTFVSGV